MKRILILIVLLAILPSCKREAIGYTLKREIPIIRLERKPFLITFEYGLENKTQVSFRRWGYLATGKDNSEYPVFDSYLIFEPDEIYEYETTAWGSLEKETFYSFSSSPRSAMMMWEKEKRERIDQADATRRKL